ncbi:RAD51-associated protein 2 [Protopterus annectens]|uniref:RAD51-associated protein 2 n=1 Tax=Protopterus annectens TaxID=7888 RepID=UPI001CFC4511|nr:RAD51-associated protein 2 [Protopterus annectens]
MTEDCSSIIIECSKSIQIISSAARQLFIPARGKRKRGTVSSENNYGLISHVTYKLDVRNALNRFQNKNKSNVYLKQFTEDENKNDNICSSPKSFCYTSNVPQTFRNKRSSNSINICVKRKAEVRLEYEKLNKCIKQTEGNAEVNTSETPTIENTQFQMFPVYKEYSIEHSFCMFQDVKSPTNKVHEVFVELLPEYNNSKHSVLLARASNNQLFQENIDINMQKIQKEGMTVYSKDICANRVPNLSIQSDGSSLKDPVLEIEKNSSTAVTECYYRDGAVSSDCEFHSKMHLSSKRTDKNVNKQLEVEMFLNIHTNNDICAMMSGKFNRSHYHYFSTIDSKWQDEICCTDQDRNMCKLRYFIFKYLANEKYKTELQKLKDVNNEPLTIKRNAGNMPLTILNTAKEIFRNCTILSCSKMPHCGHQSTETDCTFIAILMAFQVKNSSIYSYLYLPFRLSRFCCSCRYVRDRRISCRESTHDSDNKKDIRNSESIDILKHQKCFHDCSYTEERQNKIPNWALYSINNLLSHYCSAEANINNINNTIQTDSTCFLSNNVLFCTEINTENREYFFNRCIGQQAVPIFEYPEYEPLLRYCFNLFERSHNSGQKTKDVQHKFDRDSGRIQKIMSPNYKLLVQENFSKKLTVNRTARYEICFSIEKNTAITEDNTETSENNNGNIIPENNVIHLTSSSIELNCVEKQSTYDLQKKTQAIKNDAYFLVSERSLKLEKNIKYEYISPNNNEQEFCLCKNVLFLDFDSYEKIALNGDCEEVELAVLAKGIKCFNEEESTENGITLNEAQKFIYKSDSNEENMFLSPNLLPKTYFSACETNSLHPLHVQKSNSGYPVKAEFSFSTHLVTEQTVNRKAEKNLCSMLSHDGIYYNKPSQILLRKASSLSRGCTNLVGKKSIKTFTFNIPNENFSCMLATLPESWMWPRSLPLNLQLNYTCRSDTPYKLYFSSNVINAIHDVLDPTFHTSEKISLFQKCDKHERHFSLQDSNAFYLNVGHYDLNHRLAFSINSQEHSSVSFWTEESHEIFKNSLTHSAVAVLPDIKTESSTAVNSKQNFNESFTYSAWENTAVKHVHESKTSLLSLEMKEKFDEVLKELSLFHEISHEEEQNITKAETACRQPCMENKSRSNDCDIEKEEKTILERPENCDYSRKESLLNQENKDMKNKELYRNEQEVPEIASFDTDKEELLYSPSRAKEYITPDVKKSTMWMPAFAFNTFVKEENTSIHMEGGNHMSNGIFRIEPLKTCTGPVRVGLSKRAKPKQLHPYLR